MECTVEPVLKYIDSFKQTRLLFCSKDLYITQAMHILVFQGANLFV